MPAIFLLEDDPHRREAMLGVLADRLPGYRCHIVPSARQAIEYLKQNLSTLSLISLDHDLVDVVTATGEVLDPGTGRDVSNFLSQQAVTCPIIIHSTNRVAADAMQFDLVDTGWAVERITPYGDLEWVEQGWWPLVSDALSRGS